ncbi:MAG: sigma 54-interacting transcriptional regulator [Desulfovibrio sp.]|nr:sigma 54-interacting transcriptional regulator [Desulfovibrio sp.]
MKRIYKHEETARIRQLFLNGAVSSLPDVAPDILASWQRCKRYGLSPNSAVLPPVNKNSRTKAMEYVTGYTKLLYDSTPQYYIALKELLCDAQACLCYVNKHFIVFNRWGNKELKNELAERNLFLGSNISEECAGTNAVALAAITKSAAWVIGAEHYSDSLQDYACAAIPVYPNYNRDFYALLIIRHKNLTPFIMDQFQFIMSSESFISAGLATSDVTTKSQLIDNYLINKDSFIVIVNCEGEILYVNTGFFKRFHTDFSKVLKKPLNQILPGIEGLLECLKTGQDVTMREITVTPPGLSGKTEHFYADCLVMRNNEKRLNVVITLTEPSQIKKIVYTVTNLRPRYTFYDILGESENFLQVKSLAQRVANSSSNVLILGESGTGKELFAHAIHDGSQRRHQPFISINCAAVPRELIGSELFGYVPGAFTGANKAGAQGKFELASGGTIFLDEIAEMPIDMQAVLLRTLEDKTIMRIGGCEDRSVDVRIIAATNKNLRQLVQENKFRLDLYYRLNAITLELVALRDRLEDIPLLVQTLIRKKLQ